MPNWCTNELVVAGAAPELVCFAAHVSGRSEQGEPLALSFEAILPTPAEQLADGGWYDWRSTRWGTKWELDPDQLQLDQQPDRLAYRFETAWTPPLPLITLLAKRFPTLELTLTYAEPGLPLAGTASFAGGVCTGSKQTILDWQQALETLSHHWTAKADEWKQALTAAEELPR